MLLLTATKLLFVAESLHGQNSLEGGMEESSSELEEEKKEEEKSSAPSTSDPVIWKNRTCENSKGPARNKDSIGVCGDLGNIRIGKGSLVAKHFRGTQLMGLRIFYGALTRVDFSESNLEAASLTESTITRSRFLKIEAPASRWNGSILRSADFSNANLKTAVFRGARLQNSKFHRADLTEADFRAANLSFADLSDANLRGADFQEAVVLGANWKNAVYDAQTRLPFATKEAAKNGLILAQ